MNQKRMRVVMMVMAVLVLLMLVPTVAAQGDEPVNPIDIFLPESLTGYLGVGAMAIFSWVIGGGFSYIQALLNTIFEWANVPLSKPVNIGLSFGLALAVLGIVSGLNLLIDADVLLKFDPQYQLVRDILIIVFGYAGGQRAYINHVRSFQQRNVVEIPPV